MGLLRGHRHWTRGVAAAACVVLLAGALAATGRARSSAAAAGDPERGRTVYLTRGCGGCHDASPVGEERPVGPPLAPSSVGRSAAAAGMKLGPYVLASIVAPRAFATPGYASGIMPSYGGLSKRDLDDLVSFVIGRPFTSTPAARVPRRPIETCDSRPSCRATVARWRRVESLPATAVAGAKIVAVADCLSCHRYAGDGARGSSAPDLTRQAARGRSRAWLVARLRCPDCATPGSGMPSYASLGTANLRRIALFLRASKGVSR